MSDNELKKSVDEYLTMLTDCLSEQTFVRDYNAVYGIDNDLDTIAQISPELYPSPFILIDGTFDFKLILPHLKMTVS